MAITTYSGDTAIIAALDTEPNDVTGLTPAQLKAKFDEALTAYKTWFNATHISELDAVHLPVDYTVSGGQSIKAAIDEIVSEGIADGSVTAAKLATGAAIGNIADGAIGIVKMAAVALSTQAQAEAGTDNTSLTSPLRVSQAITALGLKLSVGTIANSSELGGTATATLPETPTCVFVFPTASPNSVNGAALITTAQSGYVHYNSSSASSVLASVSGTTLTLTNGASWSAAATYIYAALYT